MPHNPNGPPTRFLCVCQWGHSRSVAMVRALHAKGHSALATGVQSGGDAIPLLSQWADKIIVMQPHFAESILIQYRHKIEICDVGPDRWVNPYHPELGQIATDFVASKGW